MRVEEEKVGYARGDFQYIGRLNKTYVRETKIMTVHVAHLSKEAYEKAPSKLMDGRKHQMTEFKWMNLEEAKKGCNTDDYNDILTEAENLVVLHKPTLVKMVKPVLQWAHESPDHFPKKKPLETDKKD